MNDNFFRKLFDNIASKTVLTLIGLIGTGVTIFAFLQEKKVDLRYEIIANTNVLDFNAEISKLEVKYDSTNLKQTKENLRIFTLKVINNGNQNILKEFYDNNDPLGLQLSSGKIIEKPDIIQVSNDYLKRNLKIEDYNFQRIKFSQVILESGEYYIIKLLVLHKTDSIPKIISFGKVAGQTKIEVINEIDAKKELNFWQGVYYGNIWVQLLRLISYFLVVVLIIIFIVFISEKIDNVRDRKRKKRNIIEFKALKTYQYTRMDDAIFDRYEEDGARIFKHMQTFLEDEKKLNENYNELSKQLKSKEYKRYRRLDSNTRIHLDSEDWTLINEMTNDGILFKEKEKLTINQAMKDTLDKFIAFLKEKGEFKKHNYYRTDQIIRESDFETIEDE